MLQHQSKVQISKYLLAQSQQQNSKRQRRSRVFTVNSEHISHFFSVSIVDFEQLNLCWKATTRETRSE